MFRELAQIIIAIQLSAAHILPVRINSFAQSIQDNAVKYDFDPFIEVAIIAHESKFNELVISKDKQDYGLMQIRAKYYGGNKTYLLTGENNINVGSYIISKDKEYCRRVLKREPTTQEWLSVYHGSPSAYRCKPTKLTEQFEDYAVCIQDMIENNRDEICKEIYWKQN